MTPASMAAALLRRAELRLAANPPQVDAARALISVAIETLAVEDDYEAAKIAKRVRHEGAP